MEDKIFQELIARRIITSKDNRLYFLDSVSMSMYGAKAWAYTFQAVGEKKGNDYLFDLGLLMGQDAAQELKEVLEKKKVFLTKKLMDLQNIVMASGFGKITITLRETDRAISVQMMENSPMDYAWKLYGEKALLPHFYAGIYSGFAQVFLGIDGCRLRLDDSLFCKIGKVRYSSR